MDLFAYGTLMVPAVIKAVCGHARPGSHAVLDDFRRRLVVDTCYPAIVPFAGDRVDGMLYAGLTQRQWALLDTFEGELYRRQAVAVVADAGPLSAQTYVLTPAARRYLSPQSWSLQTFETQHMHAFMRAYTGFAALDDKR